MHLYGTMHARDAKLTMVLNSCTVRFNEKALADSSHGIKSSLVSVLRTSFALNNEVE